MRAITISAKRINNLRISQGFASAIGGTSSVEVVRQLPPELSTRIEHFKTLAYLEGVRDRQAEEERKLEEARRAAEAARNR